MGETVRIEQQGAVTIVTLNRPASLNSLNSEMSYELRDSFSAIAKDKAIRAVVLRGEGNHFMAGGDIAFFKKSLELTPDERKEKVTELIGVVHEFITTLRTMPQPVIASVRGNVAGFGMSLVAASDLAIASENALFTQAYSQIGTSPDGGNTFFLPRAIGTKRSMAMTLLNEPVEAEQAMQMGLINKVVADDELETVTLKLAGRLAQGPTQAYGRAKQLMNSTMGNTLQQQLDAEQERFARCSISHDFAEGVTAFMEKRRADFTGE
ncbi:enoyl-CoA hydratase/isomerase family protein [Sedimenticola selenatireducens]|uniref:Enoyl-CoA hydratase n=1 Tax=Sedimenticola selenatireducens TaxID=191960 RepID=A0A557RSS5_9GAMM|nr:enoyl-CoA hydratase [Sedimenticola selenatireducens]TVO68182.1 enoyl-CoA hydratase [Sedimenticola selenatireducens]TVT66180.1 MAG: enoyl-CoA hydratase [Sedimenticola selenatireducens]